MYDVVNNKITRKGEKEKYEKYFSIAIIQEIEDEFLVNYY